MVSILVDTGVWLALCDPREQTVTREVIDEIYERVRVHSIVVALPVAYETLRTRVRLKRHSMERFEREIRSPRVVLLDDASYREEALALSIQSSLRQGRPLSIVDCALRLLIDDVRTRIRYLVTFNHRDFADVCARHQIELWSQ